MQQTRHSVRDMQVGKLLRPLALEDNVLADKRAVYELGERF